MICFVILVRAWRLPAPFPAPSPPFESQKIHDENLLIFLCRRGAKESDRSREELSNEYLFAKTGFDIAENESPKV